MSPEAWDGLAGAGFDSESKASTPPAPDWPVVPSGALPFPALMHPYLKIKTHFAKLHPYFKRRASGRERERHCVRILRKLRENTVAPYTTLPYGWRL